MRKESRKKRKRQEREGGKDSGEIREKEGRVGEAKDGREDRRENRREGGRTGILG